MDIPNSSTALPLQATTRERGQRAVFSWDNLINSFILNKKLQGVSPNTVANYTSRLQVFSRVVQKPPTKVTKEDIAGFLVGLKEKGRKPSTLYHYCVTLKVFFKWLQEEGLRDDNPCKDIPLPKLPSALPAPVTLEHFLQAISHLKTTSFLQVRALALFSFLFDTGCRVSEALSLTVGDVDLLNKTAVIKQGKGGKQRVVFFSPTTARVIHKYLLLREKKLGSFSQRDWLFVNRDGSRMHKDNVHKIWQRLQRKAGLKPLPVHALRAGFARAYLLSGGDAFTLQFLLGHSDIKTTARYVRLWGQDLQEAYIQHSPLAKVKLKGK